MKVVITGGTGFIGFRLAKRLLELGALTGPSGAPTPIDAMTLFDAVAPATRPDGLDPRARIVTGDIADRATVAALIDRDDIAVFHLASVVSGGAEQDFDLGMRVNLDGHLHLLEALRARKSRPRIVFASSGAVFGGDAMPAVVTDQTKQNPQTTYGMTKAIGELLINDYSRKGFVDGRSARLPTVIIRPGKPNKAASSFASGMFREPLAGIDFALPVSPETRHPVAGYRTVVEGFVRLHELPAEKLGTDRAIGFPSIQMQVGQAIEALKRVAGPRKLGKITLAPDPFIERIVAGWATDSAAERALALGLPRDGGIEEIIRAYIEDYAPA